MNSNRGFTLVEVMIALVVVLIISIGFLGWAGTVIQNNVAMSRNNAAYNMALDIGDRLAMMEDNALIRPDPAGTSKRVGWENESGTGRLRRCVSNAPTGVLTFSGSETGLTIYTNPLTGTAPNQILYLYDLNTCTTANQYCLATSGIDGAGNGEIDHPNLVTNTDYNNIRPVRFIDNTTFYAVWSIAYMPCNAINPAQDTNRRKIFITVYWIDPEPTETTITALKNAINAGTYNVKNVSIVIDKVIGLEG